MLTLTKYLNIAERMLIKHTNGCCRSEDAIAYVAHYLMIADRDFDGRGDQAAFRGSYGRFAIYNWLRNSKKERMASLDYEMHEDNKLLDRLEANEVGPHNESILGEILEDVDKMLTNKQKRCLLGHLDGETYESIGQTFSPPITKERVRQIINSSIEILRRKHGKD